MLNLSALTVSLPAGAEVFPFNPIKSAVLPPVPKMLAVFKRARFYMAFIAHRWSCSHTEGYWYSPQGRSRSRAGI